jgi:hypothetical protein
LGFRESKGEFKYNIMANASHLKNEVTELDTSIITEFVGTSAGPSTGNITRFDEGFPVWYFYGHRAIIIKDMEEAIPDLPLKSELPSVEMGRATKGAARFLLGKTYLFLENRSKAAEYFEDIINSGIYDLEANYVDIVSLEHEIGIESIFEINYTKNAGDQWDYHHDGNVDIRLCGVRSLAFFILPSPQFYRIRAGWGFVKPTTDLVDAYIAANDIVRLNANIILGDSLPEYLPYFRNFFLHSMAKWTDNYGWEGFIMRKYQAFSGESSGNQYKLNFIVYRMTVRINRNYTSTKLLHAYSSVSLIKRSLLKRSSFSGRTLILKSLIFFVILFSVLITHGAGQDYELVWSDEFNYSGLPDHGKWTFETGGDGWGNNELQYHIILNLVVGGNWPGAPDETTVFPQEYQIDYVCVYALPSDLDDRAYERQFGLFPNPSDDRIFISGDPPAFEL